MGAFMITVLRQSAEVVWEHFSPYHAQIMPFRDASYGDCQYECTVIFSLYLIFYIDIALLKGIGNSFEAWMVFF
jgi:hypothetical protein